MTTSPPHHESTDSPDESDRKNISAREREQIRQGAQSLAEAWSDEQYIEAHGDVRIKPGPRWNLVVVVIWVIVGLLGLAGIVLWARGGS